MSVEALLRGERRAVASALNDVEDVRPEARARTRELLQHLSRTEATHRAHRVGITGPPGVGKSSLVAALVRELRRGVGDAGSPRTVGVLAVDPSSMVSGGALLGDRVRIASDGTDEGLFIRSLATRGELGGLARVATASAVLLAAAFDVVIVETVGVGQSETDVRDLVDTLVFVLQPGAGDTLQHLKAGIMEVPDIFVVNKADVGGPAERTRSDLTLALASLKQAGIAKIPPPVVSTSARDRTGIAALVAAIDAHRAVEETAGVLREKRRARAVTRGARAFARRYGELGVERAGGLESVSRHLADHLEGEDVATLVDAMNPFASAGASSAIAGDSS